MPRPTRYASSGLVSLTTEGDLRWSAPGSPTLYEEGAVGAELDFGPSTAGGSTDLVHLTVDQNGNGRVYAFEMVDGDQRWATPISSIQDYFMQFQHEVAAVGNGVVTMTEFNSATGWGLQAFDADDGSRTWRFDPGIASGASAPTTDDAGNVYFVWDLSRLTSVAPDGSERWTFLDFEGLQSRPSLSPSGDVVIVSGATFGQPGFVEAVDAQGNALWKVALPVENGNVVPEARALFTPDGTTAYQSTSIVADDLAFPYSYVYALEVDDPTETYCLQTPNSTGVPCSIGSTGSTSLAADDFTLTASGAPANKLAVFLQGSATAQVPFGDGFLCVGGSFGRLQPAVFTSAAGTASLPVDFDVAPAAFVTPSSTWHFQFWYRDPTGPGGSGYNLSDGLSVTFAP